MLLLFLVNFVARKNFVGKRNAQRTFTTTTTGPIVLQDVTGITGVCLAQAHQALTLGAGGPTDQILATKGRGMGQYILRM